MAQHVCVHHVAFSDVRKFKKASVAGDGNQSPRSSTRIEVHPLVALVVPSWHPEGFDS
jgi:hypothetical protein